MDRPDGSREEERMEKMRTQGSEESGKGIGGKKKAVALSVIRKF